MSDFALLIKAFEKQLGTKAKYLYACLMPVIGAVAIGITNDGKFGAVTLKEKNDEGITSIGELSKAFDENIKATKEAAEGNIGREGDAYADVRRSHSSYQPLCWLL